MATGKKGEEREAEQALVKTAKTMLLKWQALDSFEKFSKEFREKFPSKKRFYQRPDLTFLREACVGVRLARALNASKIRVSDRPDVWIRVEGCERGFEVVELIEDGRTRGDEAWDEDTMEHSSEASASRGPEQILTQLREVVRKKCRKRYSPSTALLVYLNDDWFETDEGLHDATSEARDKFIQVWVLWDNRCYLLWDDGVRSTQVL
jgi:hypothetical protein